MAGSGQWKQRAGGTLKKWVGPEGQGNTKAQVLSVRRRVDADPWNGDRGGQVFLAVRSGAMGLRLVALNQLGQDKAQMSCSLWRQT